MIYLFFFEQSWSLLNACKLWVVIGVTIETNWHDVIRYGKMFKYKRNKFRKKAKLEIDWDWQNSLENPLYSPKTQSLRLRKFFSKKKFDTGFEINFVGTMNISSYTQSEQARIAEKYITRLAKNGMVVVMYLATLLPSFWKGRQPLPWSLDHDLSIIYLF